MAKMMHCRSCGQLVLELVTGTCEQAADYRVLQANTEDAAQEKHVPVVTRTGNHLEVQVGSVEHPMTEEHLITTILVEQGQRIQIQKLTPQDAPKAQFEVEDGPVTVYEFCNKHGLWKAEA